MLRDNSQQENGMYPIGSGNGKIQNCDSLTGTDYALGGKYL